jgi:tyrosinase
MAVTEEAAVVRVRSNVAKLTRQEDWPDTLVAYERAVGLMRAVDPGPGRPSVPTGWRYQAAIHGLAGPGGRADTSDPLWNSCQHGSWFFLPWHRMYLAAFERIVQHHLGDDGWSLPYWYAIDPDRPRRAILPAAFREDRADNNLFTTERSRRANRGRPFHGVIPFEQLSSGLGDALAAGRYATADGVATFGGGKRARPAFSGDEQGLLEGTPHGAVHVLVGSDLDRSGSITRPGWMASFFTAALDPIFWLHHANLDRLWQVWMDLGRPVPRRQRAWMDTSFTFPAPEGGSVTWTVAEVLDTTNLGHRYEDFDPPSGVGAALDRPVRRRTAEDEPTTPTPQREVLRLRRLATPPTDETDLEVPPRVIGAVAGVALSPSVRVEIPVTGADQGRTYLRVEGVTGTVGAATYALYLGVPLDEPPTRHPELRVGMLTSFGVPEASIRGEQHDGDGVTTTYDVTAIRGLLQAEGRWGSLVAVSMHAGLAEQEDGEEPEDGDAAPGPTPDMRARRLVVLVAAP